MKYTTIIDRDFDMNEFPGMLENAFARGYTEIDIHFFIDEEVDDPSNFIVMYEQPVKQGKGTVRILADAIHLDWLTKEFVFRNLCELH